MKRMQRARQAGICYDDVPILVYCRDSMPPRRIYGVFAASNRWDS